MQVEFKSCSNSAMAVGQITYVKFFQELTIHEVKTAWKSKVYKYIQCSTGTKGNTEHCVRPPRTPFSIFKTKMISIVHTEIANCRFNLYCYKSNSVRKESTRGKLKNK